MSLLYGYVYLYCNLGEDLAPALAPAAALAVAVALALTPADSKYDRPSVGLYGVCFGQMGEVSVANRVQAGDNEMTSFNVVFAELSLESSIPVGLSFCSSNCGGGHGSNEEHK